MDLDTASPGPLLSLPRELRDQIYELALGGLISNALYIRKFDADPHWKVCYNPNARVPGILLTSRLVYSEAKRYIYGSCNPPRIVVDHWSTALHAKIMSPEVIEARRGFKVRNLDTILPILETVEELNLEVKATVEDDNRLLLLSWIRSVLNQREKPLRHAIIGVHGLHYKVLHEAERILALNHPHGEVWLLERARRDDAQGPPKGIPYRDTYMQSHGCTVYPSRSRPGRPDHLPPSMAWRNLIYGESNYWVGTWLEQNKVTVHPRRRWMVAILCYLCDILDKLWFHDLWFGGLAGRFECCVCCLLIHIGSLLEPRIGALGWPSTRAHIGKREADRVKAIRRRQNEHLAGG